MKIVIAAEIFPPDIGGPATYANFLAYELLAQEHRVAVIAYGEKELSFPFPVTLVSRRIPFFVRQFVYFLKLLRMGWDADLVYAQGPSVGPAAIYVKRIRGVKVVVKYPGDQAWQQLRMRGQKIPFEEFMSQYGKKWWGWKLAWIIGWQQFSLEQSDAIIVPSLYLKGILTNSLKVPEGNITMIQNGVVLHTEPKRILGTKNILFVQRLENWKGLETVISALAHLPEWTLTVVGDGSERKNAGEFAHDFGVAKRVVFTGTVPHVELPSYFSQAFCFVLASEYEGMPHMVIESWAQKVPVIVSDFPANTELVKDGETGLVCKLHDTEDLVEKIRLLARDLILYEEISDAGFQEYKKYDKELIMKRTIEFLSGVVVGNRAP